MSTDPVALIPRCEECWSVWLPAGSDRWRCYLDDEDQLVFFCRECAERDFDDD